jgi:myo-inositol-1(or 4)-monophosphatase
VRDHDPVRPHDVGNIQSSTSPSHAIGDLGEVAVAAVQAGALAVRDVLAGGRFNVRGKSASHDLVTDADQASERAVLAVLHDRRPDDAVLAEESGVHRGRSGVRWLVDPLDGTVNFVHGRRDYAVAVAAESSGDFVAAAIHRPGDGEWAAAGGGVLTGSGEVVGLTAPSDLRQALIGVGFPYDLDLRTQALSSLARLIPAIRDFRRIGSAACDTLALVQGRLHVFVGFGLAEWDTAAARAIVPAAGGACADMATARGLDVFIAGTVGVVDAVVDVLREG